MTLDEYLRGLRAVGERLRRVRAEFAGLVAAYELRAAEGRAHIEKIDRDLLALETELATRSTER